MTNSREPSFDSLLRNHLGRQLRADGFKLIRSRTYERAVREWTQQVYIYRFRQAAEFTMEFTMVARDAANVVTGRYLENGRDVAWGAGFDLEEGFVAAANAYCTRIRPVLGALMAAGPAIETVAEELRRVACVQAH